MRWLASFLVSSVILVIVLVPIGEAGAVPFTYEFTSGALTGTFTADVVEPRMFIAPFVSWDITAPTGFGTMVWNSGNPNQAQFDNEWFAFSLTLDVITPPLHLPGPSSELGLNVENLGLSLPDNVSGTYSFISFPGLGDGGVTGTGDWVRLQPVPEPNTLWLSVLGVLALVGAQRFSPTGDNRSSS
jgi:hypothetical protein